MVDVISNILIYGLIYETYVLDEDSDDELVLSKNDILNYKGKQMIQWTYIVSVWN